MILPIRIFSLFLAFLANATCFADETGQIVSVIDGDTVDLMTDRKILIRVRLSGIDAPEKSQAFSNQATQELLKIAFGKRTHVVGSKNDRYGRFIGKITIGGMDINLQLIRRGLAWHYKKYEKEQTLADRLRYAQAERYAHAHHIGLWADASPIPPWDFRRKKRGGE